MELAKFLVLRSPNIGNIGTIKEKSREYTNPDCYKISDSELEEFKAMSNAHKKAFIQEKLAEKQNQIIAATPEKKNAELAEVETKLVETPIIEAIEETENEVETIDLTETSEVVETVEEISEAEYNEIKEEYKPVVDEMISNAVEEITKPKAKGRPKKTN